MTGRALHIYRWVGCVHTLINIRRRGIACGENHVRPPDFRPSGTKMPTTHIQVGALASANGKHGLHRDPGLRDRVAVNGLLVLVVCILAFLVMVIGT